MLSSAARWATATKFSDVACRFNSCDCRRAVHPFPRDLRGFNFHSLLVGDLIRRPSLDSSESAMIGLFLQCY